MKPLTKIVVIGLGQELRGDDAAGIEVVRRWQREYATASRSDVNVIQSPLPGLALLDQLEGARTAILVDAVQGEVPGKMHILDAKDLAGFGKDSGSAHGWGVAETLDLAKQIGAELPERVLILGIEGDAMELGAPMSAPVAEAIPAAVKKLHELVVRSICPTCSVKEFSAI